MSPAAAAIDCHPHTCAVIIAQQAHSSRQATAFISHCKQCSLYHHVKEFSKPQIKPEHYPCNTESNVRYSIHTHPLHFTFMTFSSQRYIKVMFEGGNVAIFWWDERWSELVTIAPWLVAASQRREQLYVSFNKAIISELAVINRDATRSTLVS